jgi:cytosine deaminase
VRALTEIGRIANAHLADGRNVDIDLVDGCITAVNDANTTMVQPGDAVHDLGGWLLLPAMAEPHAHLDKALTADLVPNPAGDLRGAIDAWIEAAEGGRITHDDTVDRATTAMEMLLVRGVTAVRSHVNVGEGYGAASVKAVHQARARLKGLLQVQTVGLVHSPLMGDHGAGNRKALDEAIEADVDLLGGCPHLEPDGAAMIEYIIRVATEAGLPLDLHVDETLDSSVLTLPIYAQQVIDAGFTNGAAASHCVSLGMQSPKVQHDVSVRVAEANMAVFALPQTNLFLQSRNVATAPPRGLTAIDALLDAGVTVGAGGDNVQDPFNLVGRSDPLETAALMVMAGHRSPQVAYDMVSNAPRMAMGLAPVNFQVGDPADFVAIDATTLRSAIADAPMARRTFTAGRLVASANQQTTIHH